MKRRYMVSPAGLDTRQVSVFDQLDNGSQRPVATYRIPKRIFEETVREMKARGWTEFTPL